MISEKRSLKAGTSGINFIRSAQDQPYFGVHFFFLQTFEYLQYVTEITWDCDLNLNLKFSYGSNLPSIHSLKVVVYSIYNSPVLETKVHGMQFATHALCQKFQVWDHLDFKCSGERCSQFESHSWDNLWRTESSKGF